MDPQSSIEKIRSSTTETDRHFAHNAEHVRISVMSQECFRNSGHAHLRSISCEHISGVTRLRGQVPSFYLKQLAHELVRHIHGVGQIVNAIEVDRSH